MTAMLNFFAWMNWAWDLKKPSRELVEKTIKSRGDGPTTYHSPLYEWITGSMVFLGPFILARWILTQKYFTTQIY